MAIAYLALGSNLGDRQQAIGSAVTGLGALPCVDRLRVAGLYETPPVGGPAGQGPYLNTACEMEVRGDPWRLLRDTQDLERRLGRQREREIRWGPRVIDIDLLLWDDLIVDQPRPSWPELILPHPRLVERAFVLLPLAELAPHALVPTTRLTVAEHLKMIGLVHEGIRRLPL
ncbi:MAG: 2-amino-4-hydroxy-6-hydroxymethyldihydropteridine diphosphokinase [Planctomycetes bacterium]|nr:2-amino-4-hydroxy-6-hydroxymethyldihydropteridine diphosphokinase [Planctomycetota bacterium]